MKETPESRASALCLEAETHARAGRHLSAFVARAQALVLIRALERSAGIGVKTGLRASGVFFAEG